jgi:hypothetical protein
MHEYIRTMMVVYFTEQVCSSQDNSAFHCFSKINARILIVLN